MIIVPCRFCGETAFVKQQDLNRKGKYYCSADCEHAATLKPVKVHCRGCQKRFWAVKSPTYPHRCPECVALLIARPKRKPRAGKDARVLVIRELLPYIHGIHAARALGYAIDSRGTAWWTKAADRQIEDVVKDILSAV